MLLKYNTSITVINNIIKFGNNNLYKLVVKWFVFVFFFVPDWRYFLVFKVEIMLGFLTLREVSGRKLDLVCPLKNQMYRNHPVF